LRNTTRRAVGVRLAIPIGREQPFWGKRRKEDL
jgi:hypothetical protein